MIVWRGGRKTQFFISNFYGSLQCRILVAQIIKGRGDGSRNYISLGTAIITKFRLDRLRFASHFPPLSEPKEKKNSLVATFWIYLFIFWTKILLYPFATPFARSVNHRFGYDVNFIAAVRLILLRIEDSLATAKFLKKKSPQTGFESFFFFFLRI